MCEIAVFLKPTDATDPQIRAQQYDYGDVVQVFDDGYEYRPGDIGSHILIVKLPGVPRADLEYLAEGELHTYMYDPFAPILPNFPRLRTRTLSPTLIQQMPLQRDGVPNILELATDSQTFINENVLQRSQIANPDVQPLNPPILNVGI